MASGQNGSLRRSIGVIPLTLYGVGVTVGAGIYVLIGEVARVAGGAAPVSFLLAAIVIMPTALSFAELAVRLPRSAGEALYVKEAFGSLSLSRLIGLMVAIAGIISSAAVAIGATGYLGTLLDLPAPVITSAIILALGAIAAWGVVQTVAFAVVISLLEVAALLWIMGVAAATIGDLSPHAIALVPQGIAGLSGVSAGLLFAFFAFIGFEDLVNMAEEVKEPDRAIPIAIVATLVITTLLYGAVSFVAVSAMPPHELAASSAPLAALYAKTSGGNPALISAIAVGSTLNTILIQMVMATRVLYGLGREGAIAQAFARVSAKTRTPLLATGAVVVCVLVLALFLPIALLARWTSAVILLVFLVVNLALLRIKSSGGVHAGFAVPRGVPAMGAAASALVFALEVLRLF